MKQLLALIVALIAIPAFAQDAPAEPTEEEKALAFEEMALHHLAERCDADSQLDTANLRAHALQTAIRTHEAQTQSPRDVQRTNFPYYVRALRHLADSNRDTVDMSLLETQLHRDYADFNWDVAGRGLQQAQAEMGSVLAYHKQLMAVVDEEIGLTTPQVMNTQLSTQTCIEADAYQRLKTQEAEAS